MDHVDDTIIYEVIPGLLSHHQVMSSLNQDLAAINFLCLKVHMRFNSKKTKCMVANRSRTTVPGYGDHTLGGAELQEVKRVSVYS